MFSFATSLAAAAVTEHISVLTPKIALEHWDGMSVTAERYGNGQGGGTIGAPKVYRDLMVLGRTEPNRILAPSVALTGYDVFARPFFLGAQADVYRIRDGRLQHVRRSAVTGGAIDRWVLLGNRRSKEEKAAAKKARKKNKTGEAPTRTRSILVDPAYEHAFAPFNRAGAPYWFAVAAVDEAGNIGPKSPALAVFPATTKGKAKAQNRTRDDIASGTEVSALPAPAGLTGQMAENIARLRWQTVPGAAGYVVFLAFADPATEIVDQPYLELSDDPVPLQKGDAVILSKKFLTITPEDINSRVWGTKEWSVTVPGLVSNRANDPASGVRWEWQRFGTDDPKPAAHLGEWFLRRSLAPGATVSDGRYFQAGLAQSWYMVLRPGRIYRWRARLRADAPVTATLALSGGLGEATFRLTPDWQECSFDFQVDRVAQGDRPGNWQLSVTAGAMPLTIDCCEVELVDAALPLFADDFPIAPGSFIRDHSQIKPGRSTADADTLTNWTGQGARDETLHTLRQTCERFSARPWIQLEWHLPKEDWLDIAAYLAAPVSSGHPMAQKRAAQGHEAPWTEAFDRIILEFGNESWNRGIQAFWSTPSLTDRESGTAYKPGEVYGLWCKMITDWMSESPFWPALEARVEWFLGGWGRAPHGQLAAQHFPLARYIGVAAYNGGWDDKGSRIPQEDGAFFAGLLAHPAINSAPGFARLAEETAAVAEATGRPPGQLRPAIYEAGPGYQISGLNGKVVSPAEAIVQEVVMKSRAAATATLDAFLLSASLGLWGANYFRIGRGEVWNSTTFNGERDVDYPPYTLPRLLTEAIAPCSVFRVEDLRPREHSLPNREGETRKIASAAVYALRSLEDPATWMVVFLNRLIDPSRLDPADPAFRAGETNPLRVRLRTGWKRIGGLTEWSNFGNFRDHNRYPVGARVTVEKTFEPDPLCVPIDFPATPRPVPEDPGLLTAELPGGAAVLWKLTGVA